MRKLKRTKLTIKTVTRHLPEVGLEPTTYGFSARRSTPELPKRYSTLSASAVRTHRDPSKARLRTRRPWAGRPPFPLKRLTWSIRC